MPNGFKFIALLAATILTSTPIVNAQQSQDTLERQRRLAYFADESRVDELVLDLSSKHYPEHFLIQNVTVVSVTEGRAVPNQSVAVKDGRIASVGPSASARKHSQEVSKKLDLV